MTRRVLLIDDEEAIRRAWARGLGKEADWSVVDAGGVDEALVLIDQQTPDIIISDIDMPGRSGLELLGELGKRNLRVPLVYLTAYMKAFSAQVPKHQNVEMKEKPISLDELRAVVRERLGGPPLSDAPFSATDYLQLACLGAHSVTITLTRAGALVGEIQVVKGEVWSAREGASAGREAFARLMFDPSLTPQCRTLTGPLAERTLTGKWEALLLDLAREQDEGGGAHTPATPMKDFTATMEEALDATLRRDHAAALKAYLAARAMQPDNPIVAANIQRLTDMGIVAEVTS